MTCRSTQSIRQGLYAIADTAVVPPADFAETVAAVVAGGAVAVQYRNKHPGRAVTLDQLRRAAQYCRRAGALFIVNDDPDLAHAVAAHGVHLGIDDPEIGDARQRLGPNALIGVSCYNCLQRAHEAVEKGADYLAFGRFFPSETKPDAVAASPGILTAAKHRFDLPIVAIGGITPANTAVLVQAGADLIAAAQGVFAQRSPRAAAAAYRKALNGTSGFAASRNLP